MRAAEGMPEVTVAMTSPVRIWLFGRQVDRETTSFQTSNNAMGRIIGSRGGIVKLPVSAAACSFARCARLFGVGELLSPKIATSARMITYIIGLTPSVQL